MERILRGVHEFRNSILPRQQSFFQSLAHKQQEPQALFITCSDSRINPNLITQTEPGDLFLIRNAGNLIPPYGAANGGEGATIEYAIGVLGIRNIIVCGHSQCGAMRALFRPDLVEDLPAVQQWFTYAEATRRVVKERYSHLEGEELERAIAEENILVQLNNLSTHPFVSARMAREEVRLFGWYYDIGTGEILEYQQQSGSFLPIGLVPHSTCPLSTRAVCSPKSASRTLELQHAH